jgi:hypothetical protein
VSRSLEIVSPRFFLMRFLISIVFVWQIVVCAPIGGYTFVMNNGKTYDLSHEGIMARAPDSVISKIIESDKTKDNNGRYMLGEDSPAMTLLADYINTGKSEWIMDRQLQQQYVEKADYYGVVLPKDKLMAKFDAHSRKLDQVMKPLLTVVVAELWKLLDTCMSEDGPLFPRQVDVQINIPDKRTAVVWNMNGLIKNIKFDEDVPKTAHVVQQVLKHYIEQEFGDVMDVEIRRVMDVEIRRQVISTTKDVIMFAVIGSLRYCPPQ